MPVRSHLSELKYIAFRAPILLLRYFKFLIKKFCTKEDRDSRRSKASCIPIKHPEMVKPDPLIYSQRHLRAKGLAVTWDNPDIELFENGDLTPSRNLKADTIYEVKSRIWNNSYTAPAVSLGVHLSYFDFGIGTEPIPVGSTITNVGVKGSASNPSFVSMNWRTPATPGHYCLQVLLNPIDDRDNTNNLGQENTDVGRVSSPAKYQFKLRNDTDTEKTYRFEFDSYEIGSLPSCKEVAGSQDERLKIHTHGNHPLPAGFNVQISPDSPTLAPDAEIEVKIEVTAPAEFGGEQVINVNAYHEDGLAGGVTLTVQGGE